MTAMVFITDVDDDDDDDNASINNIISVGPSYNKVGYEKGTSGERDTHDRRNEGGSINGWRDEGMTMTDDIVAVRKKEQKERIVSCAPRMRTPKEVPRFGIS